MIRVSDFIARAHVLGALAQEPPRVLTSRAEDIVRTLIGAAGEGYRIEDGVAVHATALIEPGAQIKGPAFIGPNCFVSSFALMRNGCWLEEEVILGPHTELKSSFVFRGSKLAHLNFVGDSVLGEDVNIEAGAIIANRRNERDDKRIRFYRHGEVIDAGVEKFGAIVGDHTRIGANAVLAPGAILGAGAIVPRLALTDQA